MGTKTRFGIRNVEHDDIFAVPVVIDIPHHEIHEGDAYSVGVSDASANSTELVEIYFKTPAAATPQKRMHGIFERSGTGAFTFEIVEGVTFSTGGTAATAYNRHRDSANTSSAQTLLTGATTTSDIVTASGGTTIWTETIGSGKTTGGTSRGTEEWIFKSNTEYLAKVTSNAAAIGISLNMSWYEHTDG